MSFSLSDDQKKQFQISTLILSGLAFVIALSWSNAAESALNALIPIDETNKNVWYKIGYALALTIAVTLILKYFF